MVSKGSMGRSSGKRSLTSKAWWLPGICLLLLVAWLLWSAPRAGRRAGAGRDPTKIRTVRALFPWITPYSDMRQVDASGKAVPVQLLCTSKAVATPEMQGNHTLRGDISGCDVESAPTDASPPPIYHVCKVDISGLPERFVLLYSIPEPDSKSGELPTVYDEVGEHSNPRFAAAIDAYYSFTNDTRNPGVPVDCAVSEWGEWSYCSKDCGGGKRNRYRHVTVAPENGGAACPSLSDSEACNTEPCCDKLWVYPEQFTWTTLPNGMCAQQKVPYEAPIDEEHRFPDSRGFKCQPRPDTITLDPKPCNAPGVPSSDLCKQQLITAARSRNAHINCTDGRYVATCDTNDIDRAAVMRAFASGPPSQDAVNCTDQQLMDFATKGVIPGSGLKPAPTEPAKVPEGPQCESVGRQVFIVRNRPDGTKQCIGERSTQRCLAFRTSLSDCQHGAFDSEERNLAYLKWAETHPEAYVWPLLENRKVHPLSADAWIQFPTT